MRPPEKHIEFALKIEAGIPDGKARFYVKSLNGLPMTQRTSDRELRDGIILTNHMYLGCLDTVN